MDNFTLISIAVGVFLAVFILVARIQASASQLSTQDYPDPPPGQNVEYQWVAQPAAASKLFILLLFVVGMVYTWISIDVVRELFSNLFQVGMILIGFLGAIINGFWQNRTYLLTNMGLYKTENKGKKAKAKPEKVFLWSELSWIKPGLNGFKYYLKSAGALSLEQNLSSLIGTSGTVRAGDSTLVVTSILMARGVKTSPDHGSEGPGK